MAGPRLAPAWNVGRRHRDYDVGYVWDLGQKRSILSQGLQRDTYSLSNKQISVLSFLESWQVGEAAILAKR